MSFAFGLNIQYPTRNLQVRSTVLAEPGGDSPLNAEEIQSRPTAKHLNLKLGDSLLDIQNDEPQNFE